MCVNVLARIPTGCKTIDRFLGGGIPSESLCLVYGEAETGKSTFALQCAVNCAGLGYKTLYIDCDGMFSAKRLFQIASGKFEEAAGLIILMKPTGFEEQTILIDRLASYVSGSFGLVVVDTITSLYRLEVSKYPSKAFKLNRELNTQLASLAQVAKIQRVAVLAVSQVRTAFKEDHVSIEPVATRVLKFWADTVIKMKPTEIPQMVRAIIEKALPKAPPQTYKLRLEETGIHEYPAR
jgi:DNA repair protein RadB